MRNIADLPQTIPVFPLPGALMLPRAKLPLHIFEPRYLAMIEDVMKTEPLETVVDRLIQIALDGGGADNITVIVVDIT